MGTQARGEFTNRKIWYNRTMAEIKRLNGCLKCGRNDDPGSLVFHHIVEAEKSFNLAFGVRRPFADVIAELRKCVVLCTSCHRSLHWHKWEIIPHLDRQRFIRLKPSDTGHSWVFDFVAIVPDAVDLVFGYGIEIPDHKHGPRRGFAGSGRGINGPAISFRADQGI